MGTRSQQVARLGVALAAVAPANEPAVVEGGRSLAGRFHYWRGASGRRYVHTIYTLIDCPMMHRATYVLVKRDASGRRVPLAVAATEHDAPSLNLADIRRRGAQLDADEVHVHLLADAPEERRATVHDLRGALAGALEPDPVSVLIH